MYAHNMTPEECLRLNGAIPPDMAESLIAKADALDGLGDTEANLQEAIGCFPEEDFLYRVIKDLGDLAKSLRGDNRAELLRIIGTLDQVETETQQSTEYGVEQLSEACKAFAKVDWS